MPRTAFEFALPDPSIAGQLAVARTAAQVVLPGEWIHVVGVYEAGAKLLSTYVNGESAGHTDVQFSPTNELAALRVGRAQSSSTTPGFWAGDVDDVRAYTGALDSEQVWAVYRDSRPKQ